MLYNCGPVSLHSPEVDICFGHMMLVSEDEDSWRAPLIAVSNPPPHSQMTGADNTANQEPLEIEL